MSGCGVSSQNIISIKYTLQHCFPNGFLENPRVPQENSNTATTTTTTTTNNNNNNELELK
jgi:hypothetical protein